MHPAHPATPTTPTESIKPKPATSDSLRLRFASNPYRSTMRALGITFQINPLSALTIAPLLLLAGLVLVGPGLLVTHFVNAIVGAILVFVGIAIWAALIQTAIVAVQSASYHGVAITGQAAMRALSGNRLAVMFLITLLTGIAVGLGLLLFVVPGLIILARLSLAPYALYDEKLGGLAALKRSWKLTSGHVWEILGSYVAQGLIVGSSGGLLSFSGGSAGLADRYYTLKAHEKARVATGPTHYSNYLSVILVIIAVAVYVALVSLVASLSSKATDSFVDANDTTLQPQTTPDEYQNPDFDRGFQPQNDSMTTPDTFPVQ